MPIGIADLMAMFDQGNGLNKFSLGGLPQTPTRLADPVDRFDPLGGFGIQDTTPQAIGSPIQDTNLPTQGFPDLGPIGADPITSKGGGEQKIQPNESEKEALLAILKNASTFGRTSLKEISELTGISVSKLSSVARKYEGRKFKGGEIVFMGPSQGQQPAGQKRVNSGISARLPAEVYLRKTLREK